MCIINHRNDLTWPICMHLPVCLDWLTWAENPLGNAIGSQTESHLKMMYKLFPGDVSSDGIMGSVLTYKILETSKGLSPSPITTSSPGESCIALIASRILCDSSAYMNHTQVRGEVCFVGNPGKYIRDVSLPTRVTTESPHGTERKIGVWGMFKIPLKLSQVE